jgi:hypothetical protein
VELTLQTTQLSATTVDDDLEVSLQAVQVQLDLGLRGPPGQSASGAGGAVEVQAEASQDLSGHLAVGFLSDGRAAKANPGTIRPVGVTPASAMTGTPARVVVSGPIDEPSWSWSPGPVYLGANGSLTQVPPTAGEVYVLGEAAGPTRLIVAPTHVATLTP